MAKRERRSHPSLLHVSVSSGPGEGPRHRRAYQPGIDWPAFANDALVHPRWLNVWCEAKSLASAERRVVGYIRRVVVPRMGDGLFDGEGLWLVRALGERQRGCYWFTYRVQVRPT